MPRAYCATGALTLAAALSLRAGGQMRVAPKRIIALTGYGQAGDKQRSREAGFDEHVVKPLALEDLKALVDRNRV